MYTSLLFFFSLTTRFTLTFKTALYSGAWLLLSTCLNHAYTCQRCQAALTVPEHCLLGEVSAEACRCPEHC